MTIDLLKDIREYLDEQVKRDDSRGGELIKRIDVAIKELDELADYLYKKWLV